MNLRTIALILIQLGTLGTSYLWFRSLFRGEEDREACLWGTLLYMTLPWRLSASVVQADLAVALLWMLLPLALWGAAGLPGARRPVLNGAALAAGLLGSGFFAYRIAGRQEAVPESIMDKGYSLGGLFSIYVYREGRPGMGAALFISLLCGLWLLWVKEERHFGKASVVCAVAGLIMTIVSLNCFPWDGIRRLSAVAWRILSAMGAPAVFFGVAQIWLCVPGARAMQLLGERADEETVRAVRALVLLSGVGYGVYLWANLGNWG